MVTVPAVKVPAEEKVLQIRVHILSDIRHFLIL